MSSRIGPAGIFCLMSSDAPPVVETTETPHEVEARKRHERFYVKNALHFRKINETRGIAQKIHHLKSHGSRRTSPCLSHCEPWVAAAKQLRC
jgi:hypothetical protein